ncbi:hypothetical protein D0T50_13650, partial [Bacteroides sp. 214]|nr:hypothetical protein [Bacteroides sp. 214]
NQVPASIGERIFARIVDYIILFLYVIATFFVLEWGVVGVWLAFPFGLTTAGVLFFLRLCRITSRLLLRAKFVMMMLKR